MSLDRFTYQGAIRDFQQARFEAALHHVLARLTRSSDELLSYEQVAEQLRLSTPSDRGVQPIPIAAIVGSVGRAADFTREFLPRRAEDMQRWARVRTAFVNTGGELPAIEVYQVGEAYFVLDGNHRVSVARREGQTYIDAHVIQIHSPVPLAPGDTPDDLICRAELAEFLQETCLDEYTADFQFGVSGCGEYAKLREQIAVQQILVSREQGRTLSFREAAARWLDQVYAPLVRAVREQNLLRWFPDHTETDLYLWVTEHQQQLQEELGWAIRADAALTDFTARANARARAGVTAVGEWRNQRLTDRYLKHLFMDLLVPLNDAPETWNSLAQAIVLAQKENALLHGLYICRSRAKSKAEELQARFQERCARANVECDFAVQVGDVSRKISERALLADLVVLNAARPREGRWPALTSSSGALWKNTARPLLLVPSEPSEMQRALLVFDGSPKSEQALFIAAYMGEGWKTGLTVLTIANSPQHAVSRDYVRAYLELHELNAEYIEAEGSAKIFLEMMTARNLDLLLIANDNTARWQSTRGGSVIEALPRESQKPVLIC